MSEEKQEKQLFFLKFQVLPSGYSDILGVIRNVSHILDLSDEIIYKFKVTGEPTVIAVAHVGPGSQFEYYMADISALGIEVTCTPLLEFHKWAELLGIESDLCQPSPYNVTDRHVYWLDIRLEYPDKSPGDFFDILKRESEIGLSLRKKNNVQVELLKPLFERKVHILISTRGEDFQKMMFTLPLFKENGHNVYTVTKAVQQLKEYVNKNASF